MGRGSAFPRSRTPDYLRSTGCWVVRACSTIIGGALDAGAFGDLLLQGAGLFSRVLRAG